MTRPQIEAIYGKTVKVSLLAAQIKTLNSVPIEIAPAIAGKSYQVVGLRAVFVYGTEIFDNLLWIQAGTYKLSHTFDESGDLICGTTLTAGFTFGGNLYLFANSDSTTGDSTMDVYVTYIPIAQ